MEDPFKSCSTRGVPLQAVDAVAVAENELGDRCWECEQFGECLRNVTPGLIKPDDFFRVEVALECHGMST